MVESAKAPLSLQESGIFEEDEDGSSIELYTRGTQTEVPGGELLQEVQRLQELRARIQERAASKGGASPPNIPPPPIPVPFNRMPLNLDDRVRELEENLAAKKERETELLDENHRLVTELEILKTRTTTVEAHVMTERIETLDTGSMTEMDLEETVSDGKFKSSLAARSRNNIRKLQGGLYCPLLKQGPLVTWPKSEPPQVQPPKYTANLYQNDYTKRSETKALTEAKRREFFERLFQSCPDEPTPMEVDQEPTEPQQIGQLDQGRDEVDVSSFCSNEFDFFDLKINFI